jgi:CheY-like chemotaxis protein
MRGHAGGRLHPCDFRMVAAVLVVEDDRTLRSLIDQRLHVEGFAPISVPNGREALRLLNAGVRVQVILLDLIMPVMDGWAFRRRQLSDPALAHIPVIALSGADNMRSEELNAAAIFRKPVAIEQLVRTIHQICDTRSPEPRAVPGRSHAS